jgi:hypothetical protein
MDVSVSEVLKEKTNNLQVRLLAVGLTTRWFKGTKEKTLALRTIKIVSKLAPVAGGTKAATSTAAPSAAAPAAAASGTAGSRMRSQ